MTPYSPHCKYHWNAKWNRSFVCTPHFYFLLSFFAHLSIHLSSFSVIPQSAFFCAYKRGRFRSFFLQGQMPHGWHVSCMCRTCDFNLSQFWQKEDHTNVLWWAELGYEPRTLWLGGKDLNISPLTPPSHTKSSKTYYTLYDFYRYSTYFLTITDAPGQE